MEFKHIHFIINPASGKEEPILSYINKAFAHSDIKWDVSITRKDKSISDVVQTLIGQTDLIVIYGGDGCVTETAAALQGTNTPMAIIPAGTANVMAKELAIPLDTLAALEVLTGNNYQIKTVDMGVVNGDPFLLRVNLGIMADMILRADPTLKDNIGQLAYGISAIKTLADAEPVKYYMEIDGKKTEETGVSLTITNSGNIGISDYTLQPGISITDGLLDVILLKDNDFITMLKVAGSTLLQNETEAVKHWKAREIVVRMDKEQCFICDDHEVTAKQLFIKVVPASIMILVPGSQIN
ncbi:diacylglycerol kinase family protein [Mucilaginibacter sp.]|uniref:diacylglycerol/lipid kinase family protein n=1 Tax=Mucilaginibacter sp. TaxID=1882438 RepID=UPI0025CC8D0A|nr:diacylglycerol kinase family protein [Mucilaginibacter sp.]